MEQVPCPIFEHARTQPNKSALIADDRTWSYGETDATLHSLCHFLQEAGIRRQQRIAFVAKTGVPTILLLLALFRLGAVACPLSHRIPQEQIHKHVEQLRAAHILEPEILPLEGKIGGMIAPKIQLDSLATFLFTSGSSGTPKIACHTYGNHYYSALGAVSALKLEDTSRWLLSLPLFHVSGLGILFRCFQQGAAVVLSKMPIEQAIASRQISHASLVPTQLYRLAAETFSSLKCLVLGGAHTPSELLQKAHKNHLPVLTTYGMTEMSSMITLSDQLLPHRELKIETDGEIWVRGKTLFEGYWDTKTETVKKIDSDGWFPTKDIGRFSPEGHLEVLGRKDRLFISGGENIQPEVIEQALCAIEGIKQAAVVPVADPEFGHRPVAFIDDTTGSHDLESIRDALRSTLPSFMHPVKILPYPEDAGLKPNLTSLQSRIHGQIEVTFYQKYRLPMSLPGTLSDMPFPGPAFPATWFGHKTTGLAYQSEGLSNIQGFSVQMSISPWDPNDRPGGEKNAFAVFYNQTHDYHGGVEYGFIFRPDSKGIAFYALTDANLATQVWYQWSASTDTFPEAMEAMMNAPERSQVWSVQIDTNGDFVISISNPNSTETCTLQRPAGFPNLSNNRAAGYINVGMQKYEDIPLTSYPQLMVNYVKAYL